MANAPTPLQTTDAPPRRGRRPGISRAFEQKREAILGAATDLINRNGVKGTTFLEIAQAISMNTTSITHYFRFKEQLAAEVFSHALDWLEATVIAAGARPDPRTRVRHFLRLHFEHQARVVRGEERAVALLSEMRTLEDETRLPLNKRYQAIFRRVRALLDPAPDGIRKALLNARTHMLMEVIFWMPTWVGSYAIGDFDRVADRLFDVLEHGVAAPEQDWNPTTLDMDSALDPLGESGPASFLNAATRLINERGYRGASVSRIAAELKVTKGSFYHHLDAKDDLVLECFRRSYRLVSCTQRLADQAGGTQWHRLATTIAALLDFQFAGDSPLLRTSALQALPVDLRKNVVERSNRLAMRFNGMLVNGIRDNSIRPIDPMIASQVIMATINVAVDVGRWASEMPRQQAVATYASTLANGIFDPA